MEGKEQQPGSSCCHRVRNINEPNKCKQKYYSTIMKKCIVYLNFRTYTSTNQQSYA